ncbi:MAG: hypothetical protein HS113_24660 [Verrucomicrobiales bacterium]|nr:hypothetical protein [Verrucomicrobiales bacterium]
MNEQTAWRLQAWLDGELPSDEAAEVLRLVNADREAAALVRELKLTRAWLTGNELRRVVPESREFYWSKIERELRPAVATAADPAPHSAGGWGWWRWVIPATLAAALAVFLWMPASSPTRQNAGLAPAEVENSQEDLGNITFRSDSEQMTVYWVNNL